ncbi:phosphotransferase enzyme family protein [Oceanirhabdus sp. W0125-5]|uniref:phosphotransferase enzyme family protein n=1 Tax=Oceanirhabdus sp. W0125-5 TaxID=2999116 RepID=UPI0022F31058|nr:phosphotransferase [Oceanirhabdus sp. W0125-5]WBW96589.1 phosphotransferase [Oceanirhabdus sp. W0125-5]
MKEVIQNDIRNNLKKIIEKKYNIAKLIEIGGYQNFIYEGEINSRKYIFRITDASHRNKTQLREEIEFINILFNNGAPVNRPVRFPSFDYVEEIKSIKETYFICIFEKVNGVNWNEKPQTDENIFNAGKALGMMHRIVQRTEKNFKRDAWDKNQYLQVAKEVIPDESIHNKLDELINRLNQLHKSKNSYGLIHSDYLFCNMLYDGDDITVIDFDECEYNWFAYDIAVYLFYYIIGANPKHMDIEPNEKLFKTFMAGYKEENQIDIFWIENLNEFFRLREFVLLSSIYRSSNLDSLGKWQKDYIEVTEDRIKNDIPFVDIDFKKLYEEI